MKLPPMSRRYSSWPIRYYVSLDHRKGFTEGPDQSRCVVRELSYDCEHERDERVPGLILQRVAGILFI